MAKSVESDCDASPCLLRCCGILVARSGGLGTLVGPEGAEQCRLARCVLGNSSGPIYPAWLAWGGGTVPRLAEAARDDRQLPSGHLDATRLAVLADALEDAGATGGDVVAHLRGPGPHVQGCFALDWLLGKT